MKLWERTLKGELWLFTPEEFQHMPDGLELLCINGSTAIKGQDEIDQDTRAGVLAYGVLNPETHPRAKEISMALLKVNNATT